MPKLIIDDREIEVAPGTKVIDAAEMLGIMIPRFCYHRSLGAVGACRVCAVKFIEGPYKGVQMSCMIDAKDGMVVSTTDPEAAAFRKRVIEFLMLSHPHDCPVCDEGGHCLLQDHTVSGGHGIRQYQGNKLTYTDQYLGPLVYHEMNRCIKCYRCSRFYQEYCGYYDLGVMQIGAKVYYGRFREGILQSPFTGNLTEICPTGVYTDKPSRYKGRRWDYERTPSVCINCGIGCLTTVNATNREIVRQESAFSEKTNGWFICDRGRYGFYYALDPRRPREASIDGNQLPLPEVLQSAKIKLREILEKHGGDSIGWVGSTRNSLETMAVLSGLGDDSARNVAVFQDDRALKTVKTAVSRLSSEICVSMREIEQADLILVAGADPVNEAPMLALAMRQASRNGAFTAVIDPRPVELPLPFAHIPAPLRDLSPILARMIKESLKEGKIEAADKKLREFCDAIVEKSGDGQAYEKEVAEIHDRIANCKKPVIVCGTHITNETVCGLAADFARILRPGKNSGLYFTLPGPNAFAAGLVENIDSSFETILTGIEEARIKALIVVECDPFSSYRDEKRVVSAFEQLDLVVAVDCLHSRTAKSADVLIPTATVFESGGAFVNQEGRARTILPSLRRGLSIELTGKGNHPPRVFGTKLPGEDLLPAWSVLAYLSGIYRDRGSETTLFDLFSDLSKNVPRLSDLPFASGLPREGERVSLPSLENVSQKAGYDASWLESPPSEDKICVLVVDNTFGTEQLSFFTPCLKEVEKKPHAAMHPETMKSLDLSAGDRIAVGSGERGAVAPVVARENMAANTIVLPGLVAFDWRVFEKLPAYVDKKTIRKVS